LGGQRRVVAGPAFGFLSEVDRIGQDTKRFTKVDVEFSVTFLVNRGEFGVLVGIIGGGGGLFLDRFFGGRISQVELAEGVAVFCESFLLHLHRFSESGVGGFLRATFF
jgi:hypothetical protein